jgi:hypothetical protein
MDERTRHAIRIAHLEQLKALDLPEPGENGPPNERDSFSLPDTDTINKWSAQAAVQIQAAKITCGQGSAFSSSPNVRSHVNISHCRVRSPLLLLLPSLMRA